MSENDAVMATFVDLDDSQASKWIALLPKVTVAVIAVGIVLGVILWATAGIESLPWTGQLADTESYAAKGQDLAVLTWCITCALSLTFLSIRQILVERKGE